MSADETPMPDVKRECKACARIVPRGLTPFRVVSPSGVAHIAHRYYGGDGLTACGHDATGPGWWWPL